MFLEDLAQPGVTPVKKAGSGLQTFQTQDSSDPRHFHRHFGTKKVETVRVRTLTVRPVSTHLDLRQNTAEAVHL